MTSLGNKVIADVIMLDEVILEYSGLRKRKKLDTGTGGAQHMKVGDMLP